MTTYHISKTLKKKELAALLEKGKKQPMPFIF